MADQRTQPIDPPAPPPALRNLFGLLPEAFARLLEGDPAVTARGDAMQRQAEADLEARRQQLYQTLKRHIPEPVKRVARGAKDYVAEQFTPPPHVEELRAQLKAMVAPPLKSAEGAAPIERALTGMTNAYRKIPEFAVDQLADAQSPGEMALNLVPELKAAKGLGLAGAVYKPTRIGRYDAFGSLVKGLKQTGEHEHSLHPNVRGRLREGHRIGAGLPLDEKSDWRGASDPQLVAEGFGGDQAAANTWGNTWGALSPSTSASDSTRESVGVRAHMLEHPHRPLLLQHYGEFVKDKDTGAVVRPFEQTHLYPELAWPNSLIKNAASKVYNINDIIWGKGIDRLSSPKAHGMGGFLQNIPGKNRGMLDTHYMYALGAGSDKFADSYPELREYLMRTEGLTPKQLAGPKGEFLMYDRVEDALIRGIEDQAKDLGLPYNQVYGDTWAGIRKLKGLRYEGGPNDILRTKGLNVQNAMNDLDRLKYEYANPRGWIGTPAGATQRPSTSRPPRPPAGLNLIIRP